MTEREQAERLQKAAPGLRDEDMKGINGLFPAYLFRRSRTGEVWTSCCGRHEILQRPAGTEAQRWLMEAPHTPEAVYRWGRCVNEMDSGARVLCPWCGAVAAVKEVGRTGTRKNLWAYRRAVALRQWRGSLWACAYDCFKDYGGPWEEGLTRRPRVELLGAYRFRPGKAEGATKCWWVHGQLTHYQKQEAAGKGRKLWSLAAPYGYSAEYGTGYDVIGWEEVEKSAFRWCGVRELARGCDTIRLLTACCFYGSKIEFLQKCGLESAVEDLVDRGKKNAAVICWEAGKPGTFLPVGMKELKRLRETAANSEARLETLMALKRLRGTRGESGLEACFRLVDAASGSGKLAGLVARMRKYGVTAERAVSYIEKSVTGRRGVRQGLEAWLDYLMAAEGVGLDLTNPIFLMPRDFERKHDEVTAAFAALQAAEKDRREREAYRGRLEKLTKRYTYTDGIYLIRPPASGAEITREGKLLHHCVGGYVDRHLKGTTTILFLRRRSAPGKPLCTIEMNGGRLIQIHGWDDERTKCRDNPMRQDPRELYKDFLEEWLAWVADGSKRDKAGRPVMKKKVRKTA